MVLRGKALAKREAVALALSAEESLAGGAYRIGQQALALVRSFVVDAPETAERLGALVKGWAGSLDAIDAEKELDIRPLKSEYDRRNERWNVARGPWSDAIALGKAAIDAYRNASRERALRELPAAAPEEQQAMIDAVVAKPLPTRKVYSARVVNEALVPREYWAIEQGKLDAVASALKEAFAVPGCELVIEEKSTL